jgi:ribonuclease D
MNLLMQPESEILVLVRDPFWVDTVEQLRKLQDTLESERLVAFDTEWARDGSNGQIHVVTIQLATVEQISWVVDLKCSSNLYQETCKAMVLNLFSTKVMLGFASKRDVHKLEAWIGQNLDLSTHLDVQSLWSGKELPGLAACTSEFSAVPLSKKEQCSDWNARPLSRSQLVYAGLDAAILPILLAEKTKSLQFCACAGTTVDCTCPRG